MAIPQHSETQMSALAADLLIESPKSVTPQLATMLNELNEAPDEKQSPASQLSPNLSIQAPIDIPPHDDRDDNEEDQKYGIEHNTIPLHSPSFTSKRNRSIPSLHLGELPSRVPVPPRINSTSAAIKPKANHRPSFSASHSHSSMTMTSVRRKSFVYRAPTVTSEKDIRTVCFYLAIHGIVIGFVGWSINILISLLYANQCKLFESDGSISLMDFLYCALLNETMIAGCTNNINSNINSSDDVTHYMVAFFIIGTVTALLPNLFGMSFGFLWKSKVPDLSALSSRQRSMGYTLMNYRFLKVKLRKFFAWGAIIIITGLCLTGEYYLDETHFIGNVKGGRWTYCTVVIFTGIFIFKLIQIITDWEFKAYSKTKSKQRILAAKRESIKKQQLVAKRNSLKQPHVGMMGAASTISPSSQNTVTVTDDTSKWDEMLEAVGDTDDELIQSQKRTALFHRDLTAFMINTTVGVLLPAMKTMPHPWNASDEEIGMYTTMLMACIGEATGFIWSACISSQTIALTIELVMKWIYNKLEKEYIPRIPKDRYDNLLITNKRDRVIVAIFNKIGAKHVHGLYVTHENWFILIVLFLWQCQWGWLNPNMFVMGAGTMMYITIVYKIRFTFLKPRIEKQYIAHLVRDECFLYMIYLFIPLQFIILLPYSRVQNAACNAITIGLPVVSLSITAANAIIYKMWLRKTRTPYLVAITKQWNNIERKLNDTRGIHSVARTPVSPIC